MPDKIVVSNLVDNFKQKQQDYEKIFGLRLANGFAAKKDFVSLPVKQKFVLTRETIGNVTQPGRTGTINNPAHSLMTYNQRIAELSPAKADIYLDEVQLYNLSVSFLANKQPADPNDINSIAGRDYIMAQLFKKIASEQSAAIFRGAIGTGYDATNATTQASSMFQGGLNLMDGLGIHLTRGYATSGTGWVGDIPGANKVVGAATNFTKATALAELGKLLAIVKGQTQFEEFVYDDDPETPGYNFFLDAAKEAAIADALDELTYKPDQLVRVSGDGDGFEFKAYPKVKIKKRRWMQGTTNIFGAPSDNLFYLHQDTASDIPSIKFQEVGRGVQILMDWQTAMNYADGRLNILWK
jgi:hypothetical protein